MTKRRRSSTRLVRQLSETAIASPEVIWHRVTRIMQSGLSPSPSDVLEFQRMYWEKAAAFQESMRVIALKSFSMNQPWAQSMMRLWLNPWVSPGSATRMLGSAMQRSVVDLLATGTKPVHRRVTANAKRLRKTRRRGAGA